jgi:hypothetical protein
MTDQKDHAEQATVTLKRFTRRLLAPTKSVPWLGRSAKRVGSYGLS